MHMIRVSQYVVGGCYQSVSSIHFISTAYSGRILVTGKSITEIEQELFNITTTKKVQQTCAYFMKPTVVDIVDGRPGLHQSNCMRLCTRL